MRLPRVRFTIRRIMIVAAIAALLVGVEAAGRRMAQYRTWADHAAGAAEGYRLMAEEQGRQWTWHQNLGEALGRAGYSKDAGPYLRVAGSYKYRYRLLKSLEEKWRGLNRVYFRLASRRWLPAPPEPESDPAIPWDDRPSGT